MDWFEKLTGFRETGYAQTRAQLEVVGDRLRSRVNGASYGIGQFELVSLQALRERAASAPALPGRMSVSLVRGNVRQMHRQPAHAGALFQVASQFNMLEMVGPSVTPEDGVTRYRDDPTQGPACAIAAGAATIWRNYFAPVDGGYGQTELRQLDGLAGLGAALSDGAGLPPGALWTMRNGYALATKEGLEAIRQHLDSLSAEKVDALRGALSIGLHHDVEATEAEGPEPHHICQAFCSALPVGYSEVAAGHWHAFAALVLEAAYEATMWAGVLNARRGASNIVFLTLLGGGAFGNRPDWIHSAVRRALEMMKPYALDVRLVSYGEPSRELVSLVRELS